MSTLLNPLFNAAFYVAQKDKKLEDFFNDLQARMYGEDASNFLQEGFIDNYVDKEVIFYEGPLLETQEEIASFQKKSFQELVASKKVKLVFVL